MTTIEITDIADVQDGDIVTLRWEKEPGVTVTLEGPARGSAVGDYTITSARFVSATREAPEWEPGTAGTATVRGVEGVRVMRTSGTGGADVIWLSASMVSGVRGHEGCHVTDFLPDDAERLRRSLEVAHEGYLKAAAGWRTQIGRMGAEVDRLEAEVERLRAARTREQIAKVLFRTTTGTASEANAGADAVLTLLEEGGAS